MQHGSRAGGVGRAAELCYEDEPMEAEFLANLLEIHTDEEGLLSECINNLIKQQQQIREGQEAENRQVIVHNVVDKGQVKVAEILVTASHR